MTRPRPISRQEADRLINEVLDAEAAGLPADSRRLVERGGPGFAARLGATRDAVSRLTLLPPSPDLRGRVLAEVHARRPFLTFRQRRHITAGRLAACIGALTTLTVITLVQRANPESRSGPAEARPVSALVRAGEADVQSSLAALSRALTAAKAELAQPMAGPLAPPRERASLRLGDTSAYEPGRATPLGQSAAWFSVVRVTEVAAAPPAAEPRAVAMSRGAARLMSPTPHAGSVMRGEDPAERPLFAGWWDGRRWRLEQEPKQQ